MAKYHTINLNKEYYNGLQQFIQDKKEYTSVKDFLKQSANEKREQIQNQEQEKLIQTLELLLQNTELTRQEVEKIIKKEDPDLS